MMQDTKELTLPISKKKAVIRGYVTGAIDSQIQRLMAQGMDFEGGIDAASDDVNASSFRYRPEAVIAANEKSLELMLVSLDGDSADVYNRVMELPVGDKDFVMAEVEKVTQASKIGADQKKR